MPQLQRNHIKKTLELGALMLNLKLSVSSGDLIQPILNLSLVLIVYLSSSSSAPPAHVVLLSDADVVVLVLQMVVRLEVVERVHLSEGSRGQRSNRNSDTNACRQFNVRKITNQRILQKIEKGKKLTPRSPCSTEDIPATEET